ncbi:polysaccharide deacetylase family protein [Salisaeta longa]|uniref:polysaccharide deacetylase family protein n=1 Tax=Salisaeta longa TaxID=503170 RepID=UPI0003B52E2C|nr:polysaccharide deacetylase family protein [Salisaeta longa]
MRFLIPPLATHGLRLVHRFFPDVLWRTDDRERVAYLTFDDGPTPDITPKLLDLLARYEAKATCFLVGRHAEAHPALVRDLHAAGHTLGNHTYTHPDAWRTPHERVAGELVRTTRVIEDCIGARVRHMRPPYGHLTGPMRQWCATHRQRMVLWDVMPGDFLKTATADGVARFVERTVRPGSVIVLHDNPICDQVALPALKRMLETLTAAGWRFEAL